MTEIVKRTDDPSEFDPRAFRRREPEGNGLSLGYGQAKLAVRGVTVIMVLSVLSVIGSNLYAGYRLEQALLGVSAKMFAEHREMADSNNQTACMVSMSPADREKFRVEFRPGAWSRWCPWIKE